MSLTSPHREGSLSRLGTLRAHGTASTGGIAKLDLDDLLIARPGWRPATTGLPLRTTGLLVLPVNREIGEGVSILPSRLPPLILRALPPPDRFDTLFDWQQALRHRRIRHRQDVFQEAVPAAVRPVACWICFYRRKQSPPILAHLMQERLSFVFPRRETIFTCTGCIALQPLWLYLAS
jgi:hypothetical protein